MAPTLRLPRAIQSHIIATNLKRVGWGMRWGCASKQGILAGEMGPTSPGFGMTKWCSKMHCCQCWSMVRGVRQMEGIGVVHLSLLNVPWKYGKRWEVGNAAESKVEARDSEQATEELGNFGNPLSSRFKAAPNSVCCRYSTSPAVFWIQPIVFSGI